MPDAFVQTNRPHLSFFLPLPPPMNPSRIRLWLLVDAACGRVQRLQAVDWSLDIFSLQIPTDSIIQPKVDARERGYLGKPHPEERTTLTGLNQSHTCARIPPRYRRVAWNP